MLVYTINTNNTTFARAHTSHTRSCQTMPDHEYHSQKTAPSHAARSPPPFALPSAGPPLTAWRGQALIGRPVPVNARNHHGETPLERQYLTSISPVSHQYLTSVSSASLDYYELIIIMFKLLSLLLSCLIVKSMVIQVFCTFASPHCLAHRLRIPVETTAWCRRFGEGGEERERRGGGGPGHRVEIRLVAHPAVAAGCPCRADTKGGEGRGIAI